MDISDCDIVGPGILSLSKALIKNTCLINLNLSNNKINSTGLIILIESLNYNTKLKNLILSNIIGINSKFIEKISKYLISNKTFLKKLDISYNNINNENLCKLINSIIYNTTLE